MALVAAFRRFHVPWSRALHVTVAVMEDRPDCGERSEREAE